MAKNTFILNFFKFYNILWRMTLPFLRKNKRLKLGFEQRISVSHHTKADIWIQAASAGEAYLAVSLIKTLEPKTRKKVLVTSMTSQGMEILKSGLDCDNINKLIDLKIEWFFFDIPKIIEEAVKIINPSVMILLETEIWPALLFFLKQTKAKIFIINARLSKKSFNHYMKTRFLWKHLAPDLILATSGQDAKRYELVFDESETKPKVKTMPNIKFESIDSDTKDAAALGNIESILPKHLPLTILASIRRQEEKDIICILKDILKDFPEQVVAIFPRHMHRIKSWEKHLTRLGVDFKLKSRIDSSLPAPKVILWDTFGELKAAYTLASVVFVGGSLKPLGGQNFMEPALKGAVTVTGPYYSDFSWVNDDVFKKGIVIKENNWKSVAKILLKSLKTTNNKRTDRIDIAQNFIRTNKGGTLQACNEILKAFDSNI
jgi:3-deoxy-D-manno-octulosonic-acid transferase